MEKTEVFFWRTRINQEKSFSFQEKACCSGQTGENPKIESEGMNCDLTTRDIIVKDKIFWPNGLIIGYEEEAIFWTDTKMTMEYSSCTMYYGYAGHGSWTFPYLQVAEYFLAIQSVVQNRFTPKSCG